VAIYCTQTRRRSDDRQAMKVHAQSCERGAVDAEPARDFRVSRSRHQGSALTATTPHTSSSTVAGRRRTTSSGACARLHVPAHLCPQRLGDRASEVPEIVSPADFATRVVEAPQAEATSRRVGHKSWRCAVRHHRQLRAGNPAALSGRARSLVREASIRELPFITNLATMRVDRRKAQADFC
jgi:hypothetical protein